MKERWKTDDIYRNCSECAYLGGKRREVRGEEYGYCVVTKSPRFVSNGCKRGLPKPEKTEAKQEVDNNGKENEKTDKEK